MWHTAVSKHSTTFMYCKGSGTWLQEGRTSKNNRVDKSNFAVPCKEMERLKNSMHASTPPDTTAKMWKLTTVAGRVLQALQLRLCGHSQK